MIWSFDHENCFAVQKPGNYRTDVTVNIDTGRAMVRRLVAGLPPRRPGFNPGSAHVGFLVDKVALGEVFP